MTNQGKVKAVVLAGTGALGMLYWKMACKDCDSIEDCDSTGVAIRKATSSVLWGMLYCTAIKVISDIAYKYFYQDIWLRVKSGSFVLLKPL